MGVGKHRHRRPSNKEGYPTIGRRAESFEKVRRTSGRRTTVTAACRARLGIHGVDARISAHGHVAHRSASSGRWEPLVSLGPALRPKPVPPPYPAHSMPEGCEDRQLFRYRLDTAPSATRTGVWLRHPKRTQYRPQPGDRETTSCRSAG